MPEAADLSFSACGRDATVARARVAILISGAGSNMAALIEAARNPTCPYAVACVLSNRPDSPGLDRAGALDVEAIAIDHTPFGPDREAHERAIHAELTARSIEWVALAGYMRLLTPWFVNQWQGRLLNIHPSLLPRHPGLDTHRRALDAGDSESGCTVHHVIDAVDAGQIIGQARVPILPGDTPETLAERVLLTEHGLYPTALARIVTSRSSPDRAEGA